MTATESWLSQVWLPMCSCDPQRRTSGAMAISGTVWLSTTQGSTADSASRNRCMSSASASPTTTPTTQPIAAIFSEKRQACPTTCHSGSPERPRAGSVSRVATSHRCGIARSLVRGRTTRPPISTPASGPRAL